MNTRFFTFGRLVSLSLLAGIILTVSCQNEAFLPPHQADAHSSIQTSIRSGEVLTGGSTVQLNLDYDESSENPPHQLQIKITDREGNSLGTQIVEGAQLSEPLPSVKPSEDRKGLFILELQLYDKNGELLNKKEIPFFKVESYPQIVQIEAYPPDSLHPESTGLLIPTVTGGEDSWVRWKMGSTLLDKGPLTSYRDGYKWTAPSSEGVYSIQMEVFPEAPPEEEGNFSFQSSESSEVQFYVQKREGSRSGELGPEERYHTLLHLDGAFRNTGRHKADFTALGSPLLAVNDGLFGYYFSSADGVRSADDQFQFHALQEAEPFTLTLQFEPGGNVQPNGHIFSAFGEGGSALLQLITDPRGNPALYNPNNDQILQRVRDFAFDQLQELSISFLPDGDTIQIKWYRNGRLVHTGTIAQDLFPREEWRGLQICGNTPGGDYQGFEGLFDEVGIYAFNANGNPSVDTNVFKRFMRRNLGAREVLAADGFERMPSDSLSVDTQSPVQLAEIKKAWAKAGVVIALQSRRNLEGYTLQVVPSVSHTDAEPLEIPAESVAYQDGLRLNFARTAETLVISNGDGRELFRIDEWGSLPLRVQASKTLSSATAEQSEAESAEEQAEDMSLEVAEVVIIRELSAFNESDI